MPQTPFICGPLLLPMLLYVQYIYDFSLTITNISPQPLNGTYGNWAPSTNYDQASEVINILGTLLTYGAIRIKMGIFTHTTPSLSWVTHTIQKEEKAWSACMVDVGWYLRERKLGRDMQWTYQIILFLSAFNSMGGTKSSERRWLILALDQLQCHECKYYAPLHGSLWCWTQ